METEDITNKNGAARETTTARGDRGANVTQHSGNDIQVRMKLTRESRGRGKQQICKTTTKPYQKGWHPARGTHVQKKESDNHT